MPEAFAKREQKKDTKKHGGVCLGAAADSRHSETHHQCRNSDYKSANNQGAAVHAVPSEMASANRGAKLQRSEQHEEDAGNDVSQCQRGVVGEHIINGS